MQFLVGVRHRRCVAFANFVLDDLVGCFDEGIALSCLVRPTTKLFAIARLSRLPFALLFVGHGWRLVPMPPVG
jgi:hypothetical protein